MRLFGSMSNQFLMASLLGGGLSVPMMTGDAYRRAESKRRDELAEDVATITRFVVKGIAAWRGAPTVDVKEPDANISSNNPSISDLASAVKALSAQITATSEREYLRDAIEEGLSWLAKKVIKWTSPSEEEIDANARFLDNFYEQSKTKAVSSAAAAGAAAALNPGVAFSVGGGQGRGVTAPPPAARRFLGSQGLLVGPTNPDGSFEIVVQ